MVNRNTNKNMAFYLCYQQTQQWGYQDIHNNIKESSNLSITQLLIYSDLSITQQLLIYSDLSITQLYKEYELLKYILY